MSTAEYGGFLEVEEFEREFSASRANNFNEIERNLLPVEKQNKNENKSPSFSMEGEQVSKSESKVEYPKVAIITNYNRNDNIPSVPKIGFVPSVPKIGVVPSVPKIGVVPSVPKIGVVPAVPNLNNIPNIVTVPKLASVPKKQVEEKNGEKTSLIVSTDTRANLLEEIRNAKNKVLKKAVPNQESVAKEQKGDEQLQEKKVFANFIEEMKYLVMMKNKQKAETNKEENGERESKLEKEREEREAREAEKRRESSKEGFLTEIREGLKKNSLKIKESKIEEKEQTDEINLKEEVTEGPKKKLSRIEELKMKLGQK